MKLLLVLTSCISLLSFPLVSVLPPLYQTRDEIRQILSNDRLGESIPDGEPILKIKRNDKGYKITTNKHTLQVNVNYKPLSKPGPAQFDFEFEQVKSRSL